MPDSLRQSIAAILISLAGSLASCAVAANTLVVMSASDGVYTDIVGELTKSAVLMPGQYQLLALSDSESLQDLPDTATDIITIGTRAAQAVYRHRPAIPVLSALITESGFAHLASTHYASMDAAHRQGVSAIYLDQPLQRLYWLGALALPDARRVGVLSSDVSPAAGLVHTTMGMEIEHAVITDDARPITLLGPIIKNSDFVIALPGKKAINVSAARWILQIGSQTRTPVIAYSKRYVASGALAAVYTSPLDVAKQIGSVLAAPHPQQGAVGRAYPPANFSIEINTSVAKALGISLRDRAFYQREIQRLEGGQ